MREPERVDEIAPLIAGAARVAGSVASGATRIGAGAIRVASKAIKTYARKKALEKAKQKAEEKQEIQEDLRKWVQEKWVDIGAPDGKGGYKPCGRSKGEKRKGYPKCVPAAKARSMSKGEKRSAIKRKRAAGNTGPKPTMVKTKMREQRIQSLQEKLCARGKAAAKRKFRVYPSAYANLYGSAVCSGKVTPGGKKKKKKKSRKNESSYYNMGLVILETLERIKGKGGFSKAKTNPDPRTAPTTKALFGKTSKAQRRKLGKEELPSGAESLTPQTGKIPGPKPGEKPGREDSHTVYHDMGMVIAEMMGLVKISELSLGTTTSYINKAHKETVEGKKDRSRGLSKAHKKGVQKEADGADGDDE